MQNRLLRRGEVWKNRYWSREGEAHRCKLRDLLKYAWSGPTYLFSLLSIQEKTTTSFITPMRRMKMSLLKKLNHGDSIFTDNTELRQG